MIKKIHIEKVYRKKIMFRIKVAVMMLVISAIIIMYYRYK